MRLLSEYATRHTVSIPKLLASCNGGQTKQQEWLACHSTPLVSSTVVVPGPIKDSKLARRVFSHGVAALLTLVKQSTWIVREQTALVLVSGPEGLLSIEAPIHDLKLTTIEPEHSHPLRRLRDIGALTPEEGILSRRRFTLPAHRYLLCERSAADCTWGKTHTLSDLFTQMEALLHDADSRDAN